MTRLSDNPGKLRRLLLAGIMCALGVIGLIYIMAGPQLKSWETGIVMFMLLAVGYTTGMLVYLTIRSKDAS